ncbi:SDR family NAD(P)-dependent oxidoreductase [Micromonospora musae]|uniref:SDR family NAD(P)-dependent oxidoreductase n=1 Tax=Micromonospora musae TaxID=1894970 RepID=A0ABX9RC90_9ACTN|nr:SDR family NAD(P)-dependent oxidoreductase [Micromonospora musae]RKN21060.1 SDR family NAD(P)-dependent oxidoreductase [Micromonospora musae]
MKYNARLTTPFGATSTTDDVIAGVDLYGKRAIVTGGASGIGVETARALAAAGAEVVIAVRNMEAGAQVASDIAKKTGSPRVVAAELELTDRASVARFVAEWTGPLHILVNNAGIMALPELHRTPEGWELQFATNHLGHFNLALGLHPALAAADGARIVSVSSSGHRTSPIIFDDIHFERRVYDPWLAYGQSKTANVLFAVEAARRWADDGITANALMPGAIRTNLQRHQLAGMTPATQAHFDNAPWKTLEQGAATSVLLAASPLVEGVSGRYFADCNEAELTTDLSTDLSVLLRPEEASTVLPHALDDDDAARLWDASLAMVRS